MSYTLAGTLDSIAEQKVQHHHFLRDSTSFPQPGSIEANLQLITELIFCICPGRVYPGVSIRLVPRHGGTKDICFILFHDVSNYWIMWSNGSKQNAGWCTVLAVTKQTVF